MHICIRVCIWYVLALGAVPQGDVAGGLQHDGLVKVGAATTTTTTTTTKKKKKMKKKENNNNKKKKKKTNSTH